MITFVAICAILGIGYPAIAVIFLKACGDKRPINKILEDL
jgi:hypothetical protein